MNEQCDVCGGTVPEHETLLTVDHDGEALANVCSWLCLVQFGILKAAEQRNSLTRRLRNLESQIADQEVMQLYYRVLGSGER